MKGDQIASRDMMTSVPTVSVVQFDNDLFHLLARQRSYKSDEEYNTTGCGSDKIMQHIIVEQKTANIVQHKLALQKSIAKIKCQRSNTRYHQSLHATLCHIGQYYTPFPQHITTQHNTTHHNATQHITTHHITSQHITTQHIATQHNTTHHNTTHHNITQHNTSHHITSHHITSQRNATQHITRQQNK